MIESRRARSLVTIAAGLMVVVPAAKALIRRSNCVSPGANVSVAGTAATAGSLDIRLSIVASAGMALSQPLAAGQIYKYDPSGRLLETIETPERPLHLAFGGKDGRTLFIAARTGLYSVRPF